MYLTDTQWSLVQPILAPTPPYSRGRPPVDDRLCLEAILWKFVSASAWYDLPLEYPSHQTVYRRYIRWYRDGLLDDAYNAILADLRDSGGLDLIDALRTRLIHTERDPHTRRSRLVYPPHLHGTWQFHTAALLVAWSRWLYSNPRRHPRTYRRYRTYRPL